MDPELGESLEAVVDRLCAEADSRTHAVLRQMAAWAVGLEVLPPGAP